MKGNNIMKLKNEYSSLTIEEDTITIRYYDKTYKFKYDGYRVMEAQDSVHYTYIEFNVEKSIGYDGEYKHIQYIHIGYNTLYNSVVVSAAYIKQLKRVNKVVHIYSSFNCNVAEWLDHNKF